MAIQQIASILALFSLLGCVPTTLNIDQPTSFDVNVRPSAQSTNSHPVNQPFTVKASCLPGETLIGGGVQLLSNNNKSPDFVVIEGSYPADQNSWAVQARNPDNPPTYNQDADVLVMSLAYCMSKPSIDLQTEIVSSQRSLSEGNSPLDLDVSCSTTDALALSGGFQTSTLPVFQQPGGAVEEAYWPGLLGSGITQMGPRLPDSTHSSMGWHGTQVYTPSSDATAPHPTVTTTLFALCARGGINRQSRRIEMLSAILSKTSPSVIVPCTKGEFTVGGGYRWNGVLQAGLQPIPNVDGNLAIPNTGKFSAWQISGDSAGQKIDAAALCIRIPVL